MSRPLYNSYSSGSRPLPGGSGGPYKYGHSSPGLTSSSRASETSKYSSDSMVSDRLSSLSIRDRTSRGVVGFDNMGNTCFMNCILQCLMHTRPLRSFCLDGSGSSGVNSASRMKGQLCKSFYKLVEKYWRDEDVTPTLKDFRRSIAKFASQFAGNSQHDAQEFLVFLLEGLHEEVNSVSRKPIYSKDIDDNLPTPEKAKESWRRYKSREDSFIIDTFVGQLKSSLTCQVCGYESVTYDPFFDLSLPIPKKGYSSYSSCTLDECLALFTEPELLDGAEKPRCAKCKKQQICTKQFTIERFPKILVVHLKRFSHRNRYSKLDTKVIFPLADFRLNNFASAEQKSSGRSFTYSLYGVANHMGSVISGHYTAFCRVSPSKTSTASDSWHSFNDRSTSSSDESRVVSSNAYVLFYELNH